MFAKPIKPNVPYSFPPVSFLKLYDYIRNIPNLVAYWPLDDVANNPYCRVINPAVAKGRNLSINGTFDADATWVKGTGWTITGGVAVGTSVAPGQALSENGILQQGRVYEISFDLTISGGSIRISGGAVGTTRSTNGTFTETLITSASGNFNFNPVSTFTGTIDNVTFKELNIPAYDVIPVQLLNTDVWNNLGTAAWTAINSAAITMQTTTRHDGASGTVLQVARNGLTGVAAESAAVFVIGQPYRIYGWYKGDGTASPRIQDGTGATLLTGTVTTDWQPFDFLWVASTTKLRFGTGVTTNNFVQFDVTLVSLDTGIRQDANLILDGDGESATPASFWLVATAGTLTKDTGAPHSGTGNIRIARTTNNNPAYTQIGNNIVPGKRYRCTAWWKSDGNTTGQIIIGSVTTNVGTTATTWQLLDFVIVATSNSAMRLLVITSTGNQFGEFDDITLTEINPLSGVPVNGVVLGNTETSRLQKSAAFDGVNDLINIYSAQLNGGFNPSTGTLSCFVNMANFSDSTTRFFMRIFADASNLIRMVKLSTNLFSFDYSAGGVTSTVTISTTGYTGWHHFAITWDTTAAGGSGEVKAYLDGRQVGTTQNSLGVFVGNISNAGTLLGAQTNATLLLLGSMSHAVLFSSALAVDYISEIAKLGDTF